MDANEHEQETQLTTDEQGWRRIRTEDREGNEGSIAQRRGRALIGDEGKVAVIGDLKFLRFQISKGRRGRKKF